jgi:hypothetical protein
MKTTATLFTFFVSISLTFSQLLGVYEFTGAGTCPNQDSNVTTQLVNSEFDSFSMQNVFCVATQNVFNTKSWNTTSEINLSEYLQFGVHTISCDRLTIDSLIFEYRNSASGGTPTWYLRSSVDNYSTDLASGISSTVTGMLRDTVVLNPADFSLLADVKFRIYLTNMGSAGATFRVDNVSIYGSETFVGTVDYYVDNDGDGYGTGDPVASCTNPGGYSLNNLDCDDNNATINPGTFWYQDNDGDGFGNDSAFEIGCTSTFANPVTNSDDCDDTNPSLNPNTIWYQDIDGDGFGDDNITEIGCDITDITLTNPVLIGGDCDDTNSDLNPNTIWYEDLDQDSYGNSTVFEIGCEYTFSSATIMPGDCDDSNPDVNPLAIEVCDEIDNNCNGQINEGLPTVVYYIDNDGDGYGAGSAGDFCSDPGIGYVLNNDDCNDENSSIHPNADEPYCPDGIDQNCDSEDGFEDPFYCDYWMDEDSDGFGSGEYFSFNCSCMEQYYFSLGYVYTNEEDCDDNNPNIYPGAPEIIGNGIDENCDGVDGYLSINEINVKTDLKIYPNPGTENFFISSSELMLGENQLKIFDINGKVIFESKLTITGNYFMEIPSADFPKGVYQIKIQNEKQIVRANWLKL